MHSLYLRERGNMKLFIFEYLEGEKKISSEDEAITLYKKALELYHRGQSWTPRHIHGDESSYGQQCNQRMTYMRAPEKIKKMIIEAGISFKKIWSIVQGVDPDTIPALKGTMV